MQNNSKEEIRMEYSLRKIPKKNIFDEFEDRSGILETLLGIAIFAGCTWGFLETGATMAKSSNNYSSSYYRN